MAAWLKDTQPPAFPESGVLQNSGDWGYLGFLRFLGFPIPRGWMRARQI